ncbi:hypothetical protein F2Q69_00044922 [Brassica cretica]|uniref:Uncharacterized protein n=1 Tax=Brassica cretica TaxID=69181 RepID=A0A8S9NDU3_BRACR|nr:hypothetical protein F2Q69_00044922 [Brassica cretica]
MEHASYSLQFLPGAKEIELLHDDLEAYQPRSSRISRTSLRLLLTPVDITAKEEVEEIDVTNGDGIDSIGLVSLVEALVNEGLYNVHVCAPQTFGEYEQRHRRPPFHRRRTPRFYSEREFTSD